MGIKAGLSPSEIDRLTPFQIITIAKERDDHAEQARLFTAHYTTLAQHDPKSLSKAIQDFHDRKETEIHGEIEPDELPDYFASLGYEVIDEQPE